MSYTVKSQTPLMLGENFIYPLTTADQVVVGAGTENERRLEVGGKVEADHAVEADKLGGKAPIYYIRPRNLLDNSDFEIAQAGYGGMHESVIYAADRWAQNDSTARTYTKVTHNGHGALKCTSETRIQQKLYLADGMPYTAACLINDKLYLRTFTANKESHGAGKIWINYQPDGTYMFIITNIPADQVLSEPVLYPGMYTAETLPPYMPKEHAAELDACHRYCYYFGGNDTYAIASGFITKNGNSAQTLIDLPYFMDCSAPSVLGKVHVAVPGYEYSTAPIATTLGIQMVKNGKARIVASFDTAQTSIANMPCVIMVRGQESDYLMISKDL